MTIRAEIARIAAIPMPEPPPVAEVEEEAVTRPNLRRAHQGKITGHVNRKRKAVMAGGKRFASVFEAAEAVGLSPQAIRGRIYSSNWPGWEYATAETEVSRG